MAPAPPAAPPPAAELTTAEAVKFYQDCWAHFNAKDFAKFAPCYSDSAISEQVDQGVPVLVGKDIVDKSAKAFASAFPDLIGEPQLILASDKSVVGIWLLKGTHQGNLQNPDGTVLAPTGKKVGYLMAHTVEVHGGKAAKEQIYMDMRTMLSQLGVMPGPVRKMAQGATEKPVIVAGGTEGETKNIEAFTKYVDALNTHDPKQTQAFLADDVVFSDQAAPADLVGKKEMQRGLKEMWKSMSDARVEPKSVWAAGDYVVSVSTLSGTNDGPIPSMKLWKKTGKKVSLNALEIAKIQDGKVKQHWVFANGLAFANQLGLAPEVKAPPSKPVAAAAKPAAEPTKPIAPAKAAAEPAKPATPAKPESAKPSAPAKP